jgi:flagellar hook-associated protein 3 FlgL
VDSLYGMFKENSLKTYQTTTEIGAKTQYLEFMTSRYETQNFNLEERQTQVEGVDAAYTYIAFQSQKVAYSAALQMGQSVVQQSVFDYMS